MESRSLPRPKARLLELVVRTALVSDARHERPLSDWSALRYFSHVGTAGRTRAGLANYLGVTPGFAEVIVSRLLDCGELVIDPGASDRLKLTQAGQVSLANDPLETLSAAIETLPGDAQNDLGVHLETILAALNAQRAQDA